MLIVEMRLEPLPAAPHLSECAQMMGRGRAVSMEDTAALSGRKSPGSGEITIGLSC